MTHRPDPILAIAVAVVFFVVVHMVYGWRETENARRLQSNGHSATKNSATARP
jgi:hypothetical protein